MAIEDIEVGTQLLATYVRCKNREVTTMRRESSAMLDPSPYYETIVWEWDAKERKRGGIAEGPLDSGGYAAAACRRHHIIVARILADEPVERDDD